MLNSNKEKFEHIIKLDKSEEIQKLLQVSKKTFLKETHHLVEYAARYNKINSFKYLIELGIQHVQNFKGSIKEVQFRGFTILQNACFKKRNEIVRILLNKISFEKEDIKKGLISALNAANTDAMKLILEYYNSEEEKKEKEELYNEIVNYIDQKIINKQFVEFIDDFDTLTFTPIILLLLKQYIKRENFNKADEVLKKHKEILNSYSKDLLWSACTQNVNAVKYVIKKFNIIPDQESLNIAVTLGKFDVAEYIMLLNDQLTTNEEQLIYVKEKNNEEIVKFILQKNPSIKVSSACFAYRTKASIIDLLVPKLYEKVIPPEILKIIVNTSPKNFKFLVNNDPTLCITNKMINTSTTYLQYLSRYLSTVDKGIIYERIINPYQGQELWNQGCFKWQEQIGAYYYNLDDKNNQKMNGEHSNFLGAINRILRHKTDIWNLEGIIIRECPLFCITKKDERTTCFKVTTVFFHFHHNKELFTFLACCKDMALKAKIQIPKPLLYQIMSLFSVPHDKEYHYNDRLVCKVVEKINQQKEPIPFVLRILEENILSYSRSI